MSASPDPIAYLFYGQDEPTLKGRLQDFLNKFSKPGTADLNLTRLDGRVIQSGDIISAAAALPFLADERIVIVENMTDSTSGREVAEQLSAILPGLPDWARIAFVETGFDGDPHKGSFGDSNQVKARRPALKKMIAAIENDPRGRVLSFDLPRSPAQWMIKRAQRYSARIEPAAAQELADRVGEDLTLADVEIAKLAAYVNGERPITVDDVTLLTPYTPEAGVFDLVDALSLLRGDEALHLLRDLLQEGEPPLLLYGMIVRQYRLLLMMKEQLERGATVPAAGKTIGAHAFVAKKLAGQVPRYSLESLEAIYRFLLETDLNIKTGVTEPELALEIFIAQVAGRK